MFPSLYKEILTLVLTLENDFNLIAALSQLYFFAMN